MLIEMHKKGFLVLIFLMGFTPIYAQKFCSHYQIEHQLASQNTVDKRADTFDVTHYDIHASFLSYSSAKAIDATTTLTVVMKKEASTMRLDLLDLSVSGVVVNGLDATFSYQSPALQIYLPPANIGDTLSILVNYAGNPVEDPQWGGFYFSGEYAYNLGVGFASDPHNFGRVWFPCFDNFVDRATYTFSITVEEGYKAYANGLLHEVINQGNQTQTFVWKMNHPIPTYLASVAMAPYEEVTYTVDGIPVILTALAGDTANLRLSFENLATCIQTFETVYGKHTFDRIGFNTVPFNAGAMEHATNIAYPRYAIANGDKSSETLFAHELAHHWWGNTITCKTQEDMWLNEGWASYSERLFLEAVYGRSAYDDDIETNHHEVLQFAHVKDQAILPVSGIGHAHTYGRHVYDKGADMVHTLRGLMGDAAFFEACSRFQQHYQFQDVTTAIMQDFFQAYTSLDLSGFFEQWIRKPGFAHFDILAATKQDQGYALTLKQTPRFNEEIYTGVKLSVSGFAANQRFDTTVVIDQSQQTFNLACPFEVGYWVLDPQDKISDATTTDQVVLQPEVTVDLPHGMMKKVTLHASDSLSIWVTHHWAPADGTWGKPLGAQLSRERYWEVQGLWNENTEVSAQLIYSGLKSTAPDYGFLDADLIRTTEDSLVLLYRPHAKAAWTVASDYTKNMGSLFDKRGTITIDRLKKGYYCLAMYDASLLQVTRPNPSHAFQIFPNPASKEISIVFESPEKGLLEITSTQGEVIFTSDLKKSMTHHVIDISSLASGIYGVGVSVHNKAYDIRRLVVE
jgi:hypothetical protein